MIKFLVLTRKGRGSLLERSILVVTYVYNVKNSDCKWGVSKVNLLKSLEMAFKSKLYIDVKSGNKRAY